MPYIAENGRLVFFVFYAFTILLMIIDILLYPWQMPVIYFYLIANGCMIFRLIGRSLFSIFLHVTILGLVFIFAFVQFVFKEEVIKSQERHNFIARWLLIPLVFGLMASLVVFCLMSYRSLHARAIYTGIHSLLGLFVLLIYFWISCFYVRYFREDNGGVILEMFYMLFVLIIMLTPELMTNTQLLKSYQSPRASTQVG